MTFFCARRMVLVGVAITGIATSAAARTWHVERDGSGDYATIQPAVEAAAPGDTILIGPGRYPETPDFLYDFAAPPGPVAIAIPVSGLTVRGTSRDSVVIGPVTPAYDQDTPKGVAIPYLATFDTRIESLTLEHFANALWLSGHCHVSDVVVRNSYIGAFAFLQPGSDIAASSFLDNNVNGLLLYAPTDNITVHNCVFARNSIGCAIERASAITLSDIAVSEGKVGIQFANGSSGVITRALLQGMTNIALAVIQRSTVELTDSQLLSGGQRLYITSASLVNGSRNVIGEGLLTTIDLAGEASAIIHQSHILLRSPTSIRLTGYPNGGNPSIVDLSDNYWGTTDRGFIDDHIWDSNDDSTIHQTVIVDPIALQPLPTRRESLGSLKAFFGPDQE